jgi:hypothetical protein
VIRLWVRQPNRWTPSPVRFCRCDKCIRHQALLGRPVPGDDPVTPVDRPDGIPSPVENAKELVHVVPSLGLILCIFSSEVTLVRSLERAGKGARLGGGRSSTTTAPTLGDG